MAVAAAAAQARAGAEEQSEQVAHQQRWPEALAPQMALMAQMAQAGPAARAGLALNFEQPTRSGLSYP